MQHEAYDNLHKADDVQHEAYGNRFSKADDDVQHEDDDDVQHEADDVQHEAYGNLHKAHDSLHKADGERHTAYGNLQLKNDDDAVVSVDHATTIFTAANHPKSFVSLEDVDHFISDADDATWIADIIGAWASRSVGVRASFPTDAAPADERVLVASTGQGKYQNRVDVGGHVVIADEPESVGATEADSVRMNLFSQGSGRARR